MGAMKWWKLGMKLRVFLNVENYFSFQRFIYTVTTTTSHTRYFTNTKELKLGAKLRRIDPLVDEQSQYRSTVVYCGTAEYNILTSVYWIIVTT
jgi:hypothetical protein